MSSVTPNKKLQTTPSTPPLPAPPKDSEGRKIAPIEEHSLEDLITIIGRIFFGLFFALIPFEVSSETKTLKRAVNFALRSNVKDLTPEERKKERELHQAIKGQPGTLTNLLEGYLEAQELQKTMKEPSPSDPEGLARIIKHRQILKEMGETIVLSLNPNTPRIEIFKRIDELEKKDSDLVVHHADGSSSFSIPGGSSNHYILYEFKRDPQGNFYFIIHNRDSADETIHGPLEYQMNNKIYAKTSVAIKVDKNLIQDKFFIKTLLDSMNQDQMEKPYQSIKDHLLAKGAEIQISSQEKELRNIKERMDKIEEETRNRLGPANLQETLKGNALWMSLHSDYKKKFEQLIENDPGFHSKQVYATCAESCLTGPEKSMATMKMRRQIKLYSIITLTAKLEKATLENKISPHEKEHIYFLQHTLLPKRQDELKEKINKDVSKAP